MDPKRICFKWFAEHTAVIVTFDLKKEILVGGTSTQGESLWPSEDLVLTKLRLSGLSCRSG